MRNRNNPVTSEQGTGEIDTDVDRFQSSKSALKKLIEDGRFPDCEAELIEVRPQANGDVTWRLTPPRAEESDVGNVTG